VARTSETVRRVVGILKSMPQVQDVFAVIGFSLLDGANASNSAFAVAKLKPFEDRRGAADSAQALIRRMFAEGAQVRTANIVAFNLPPIIGLSTSGGFEYQLEALEGQDPVRLGSVMQGLVAAANQDPRLSRVFSTFSANNPSIYLDIDRDKAQALGLGMNDVFQALQSTLGGLFVNNFNLYGRTWQVNIQGEANDRRRIESIWQIQVRNKQGEMVPMRSIAELRFVLGPQVITRYNNYRSISINGAPAPGRSSGDALAAMKEVSDKTLPPGFAFEWTGTAFQEYEAQGQTGPILALAVIFAFLFLVALYESWIIPMPVLLSVSVGVLGAYGGILIAGLTLDLYAQIGLDPDRGVRQGGAREGRGARPCRGAGRAHALPVGDDDVVRLHPRSGAAGVGAGRRADQPARHRHLGVRRHDRRQHDRHLPCPDALCRLPAPAGMEPAQGAAPPRRGAFPKVIPAALSF
jgi:multidrug efflux pump subunit AcrB